MKILIHGSTGRMGKILCQLLLRWHAAAGKAHEQHVLRAVQSRLCGNGGFYGLAM